jgi:hypothetical protein
METATADPVYVVSLASNTPSWSTISWRDIVNVRRRYFHPVGRRWPKDAVNWLGFRYDARLQSIHHVESVITIACRSEFPRYFPEINGEACRLAYDNGERVPHFIYTLSAATYPNHVVSPGKIYQAARVWADLDLLLSSESISEAAEFTRQRRGGGSPAEPCRDIRTHPAPDASPPPSIISPPINDADSLIARIKLLAGVPERNHEDAVKDLLIRLGHKIEQIFFQVGRIDVSLVNQAKKTVAVIEVKRSIAAEKDRMDARRQGMDYAGRTGAAMVVITDGDRYEIYDRRKLDDYNSMFCGRFQLSVFRQPDCPILDLLRPSMLWTTRE